MADAVTYDEIALIHETAADAGLSARDTPPVRRIFVGQFVFQG